MSSHTLGLSWDSAFESIQEMALNNGATTNTAKFSPLNLEQLQFFPNLRDKCYHEGLICIPDFLSAMEYDTPEGETSQLQATVYQLVEDFPLLCVAKDEHFVLLDYAEIVFNPGLVSEVLTLYQNQSVASDNEPHTHSQTKEGMMFFKKLGLTSMQQKYPKLLTTAMELTKLHGFPAHA